MENLTKLDAFAGKPNSCKAERFALLNLPKHTLKTSSKPKTKSALISR